jgi:REP element-mobilizing transposase RayT
MREYWDRYIRDEKHLTATLHYIHQNPVSAGLVDQAEDWPWSSASEFRDGWGYDSRIEG